MEKDTKNYMEYKMGFSKKILLTDEAVPSKFHCQKDRRKRMCAATSREVFVKRQRKDIIKECEEEISVQSQNVIETTETTQNICELETEPQELSKTREVHTNTDIIITADKSIQTEKSTTAIVHYRSKSTQTRLQGNTRSTSPMKICTTSQSTSPFKTEILRHQTHPSISKVVRRNVFQDSDVSCSTETGTCSPPYVVPSSSSTVSDFDVTYITENIEKLQSLKNTMRTIQRKPLMYLGISKECYFLIDLLHEHTNIKVEYILLCLKKIRLNSTFSELEDNFSISLSYASKLFLRNIPIIASALRPFIVTLDKYTLKKNLPIAFRHNYHNVSCIIDCLEIDIQKPSKALYQALTWSDYKKGNTVKYLISCTPNGLVNYVSRGFGGRTSDVTIVENCDFLDGLENGTFILADRGFKHIEQILNVRGLKLLKPPSLKAGTKMSKAEVRQTKIIASLRIHVERVIRRLREFYMLKQHSVINSNTLCVLDHVIIIACALINLHDSLIK